MLLKNSSCEAKIRETFYSIKLSYIKTEAGWNKDGI